MAVVFTAENLDLSGVSNIFALRGSPYYMSELNDSMYMDSIRTVKTIACSPGNEFGLDSLQDGNTLWTPRGIIIPVNLLPISANWYSVASSSDGTRIVGCINGGSIWTGVFSTVWTWTEQTAPNGNWRSVASSSDGKKIIACSSINTSSGSIWAGVLSGTTWTWTIQDSYIPSLSSTYNNWVSVTTSSDGICFAACISEGGIYTIPF